MRLLNLSPLPPEAIAANLDPALGVEVVNPAERTEEAARAAARGAAVVLGDFASEIPVTADVVAAMTSVRHVHQPITGYDLVDVDALTAAGIPFTNAGRVTSVAMAEHTVMVILALLKSLLWCDAQVRAGAWPQHEVVQRGLVELRGRTVGLVGLGGAGEETARRLAPFGCTVLYTARRRRDPAVEEELGVRWAELAEVLAASDVVCLLVDLNAGTRGMIGADALQAMKPGAFLVNPSRGALVDEVAVAAALERGHLAGAALDVFAEEPLPVGSPLRWIDAAILTPHVAGATAEVRLGMLQRAFAVISAVARGELPGGVLNGVTRLRLPD
jgi:D-3-phosphoglycerate dehydrogenase / 2-oxoglutarate reductase